VPLRLRPTGPVAADAVLVGDPGRALLLAQALLEQPKMSNHARGLWGYHGRTPAGDELTVQATGIGGPSAALVLADLTKLGVRRAVRIGTCVPTALGAAGRLLLVTEAIAGGGSASAFETAVGEPVAPDAALFEGLRKELGGSAREAIIGSVDAMPPGADQVPAGAEAVDMQTVAVLARARSLGVAAAAVLIVEQSPGGPQLPAAEIERGAVEAGEAAVRFFSTSS